MLVPLCHIMLSLFLLHRIESELILMIDRVLHNSHDLYYRSVFGAAEAESEVRIGLSIYSHEAVKQVLIRLWQEGVGEKLIPLHTDNDEQDNERYYSTILHMPDKGCLLWYYFIIVGASGTVFYGNNNEQLGGEGGLFPHVPPSYQITVYNKGAKTPDWFKHSVMYQIFPDRFYRDGNEMIEKKGAVYHADWNDAPCYYKDPDTKEIVAYDFYGGNIRGIEKKLDYLKELGISTIYLNPVFESESNHHYDTGDYHKIDPILGTNEEFKHFLDTAKSKGIHVLIDGVFSHTGSNSRYFNRESMYDTVGAFQSKNSPYYKWYNFRNFPNEYDSWWGFTTLPNVNETDPSYMDFIIHGENSVLHHWLREGIDGWRLDVIDELPAAFSQAFYKALKEANPEAVMIGEVWEDASHKISYGVPREYLCGQEMDSAMNYPFRENIFDFLLGHIDAQTCSKRMESLRENYPKENYYAMMNLIGSHDVMRAVTLLGEGVYYDGMPAVQQARARLDDTQFHIGTYRLLMAALWQMTFPGVPCVYYGDEIAMQGFKDPYNRRPYEWDGGDDYVFGWYKKFIAERNSHAALRTGKFLPLLADGDIYSYARVIKGGRDVFGHEAEDDSYVIAFNRSRTDKRTISVDVSDFADGVFERPIQREKIEQPVIRGRLTFELEPLMGAIWRLKKEEPKYERQAGVLMHPTSLPSKYGIGDLGREAYKFIDFLADAGQKVWQILPLNPVGFGYSPYQSPSAFAGNPLLISIDKLIEQNLLSPADVKVSYISISSSVDFERVNGYKQKVLRKAFQKFSRTMDSNDDYQAFCRKERDWLDDYALFQAIKKENTEKEWTTWPMRLKQRDENLMREMRSRLAERIAFEKFKQYIFDRQWGELHAYAKEKGVSIMGDMPIFISADSSDVWANQSLFDLNVDGTPKTVAGVPPDYFSSTGQLWGNPQYDWEAMANDGYDWWIKRFRKLYELVDIVRIDHFRGFESYWEVPGDEDTAINGKWRKGPGKKLFDAVERALGKLPIVAEDLGIITDEVERLRDECGYPGMKVLHFTLHFNEQGRMGFVAPENSIVYTGTHDNNTTVGWYESDINERTRSAIASLLGADMKDTSQVTERLIEFAYASNARMAIIPMQDFLKLRGKYRMNTPGTVGNNWKWCLKQDWAQQIDAEYIRNLAKKTGRV